MEHTVSLNGFRCRGPRTHSEGTLEDPFSLKLSGPLLFRFPFPVLNMSSDGSSCEQEDSQPDPSKQTEGWKTDLPPGQEILTLFDRSKTRDEK